MSTPITQDATDDELTLAVHERGDAQAFALLYERHSSDVYDFVCRILRDADVAADVTQDSFANAWNSLKKRSISGNVRAWLFTIARNRAINEIRSSRHLIPKSRGDEDDPLLYARVDPDRFSDPEKAVIDQELADLVWDSASALKPREYTLLDMHVRRGLSPEEIADATGVSKRNIYVNLFRLRRSLERSVAGMLMMRRGRRECPELDGILAAAGAEDLTPRIRNLVDRHIDQCGRCQDLRRHIVSPIEIFASLAFIPLPEESRIAIWNGIILVAAAAGAGVGAAAGVAGGPVRWFGDKLSGVQAAAVAGVAVVAAGVIGVTVIAITGDDGSPLRDPDDVRSSTHRVGELSSTNVIEIAWSRQTSAAGYSIEWSRSNPALPDQSPDLPGDASSARSRPLPAGRWYFNLRTQNHDRRWTSTVHLGPFIIGPVAVSAPRESSPGPSPSPAVAAASASPVPVESPSVGPPSIAGTDSAAPVNPGGVPIPSVPPAATPSPPPAPSPPLVLNVRIDVIPGEEPNKVHLHKDPVISVAIFASGAFDPIRTDVGSARLLGASAIGSNFADANGDGDRDLVLEFRVAEMRFELREVRACLTGVTKDGQAIQGCDGIRFIAQSPWHAPQAAFLLGLTGFSACLALVVVRKPRR